MEALLDSLLQLVQALWGILVSLKSLLLPWLALAAWVAFWMFAVDWSKLRPLIWQRWGSWVGVALTGFVMILVWGSISPPTSGTHDILGLELSNYVGKTVYVTVLFCIMFLCGSVQLSGCCASCCNFADEPADEEHHAAH